MNATTDALMGLVLVIVLVGMAGAVVWVVIETLLGL